MGAISRNRSASGACARAGACQRCGRDSGNGAHALRRAPCAFSPRSPIFRLGSGASPAQFATPESAPLRCGPNRARAWHFWRSSAARPPPFFGLVGPQPRDSAFLPAHPRAAHPANASSSRSLLLASRALRGGCAEPSVAVALLQPSSSSKPPARRLPPALLMWQGRPRPCRKAEAALLHRVRTGEIKTSCISCSPC